jgi:hypothetical protein
LPLLKFIFTRCFIALSSILSATSSMPMSHWLPRFLHLLSIKAKGTLDSLPEDVLVDDIFVYLAVEDVMSLRQVSKL